MDLIYEQSACNTPKRKRNLKLHMTPLIMPLLAFKALNVVVMLQSMQDQKALRFNQKHLHLCSEDE